MSLYSKYNERLRSDNAEYLARSIADRFGEGVCPPEFFYKLKVPIQEALLEKHRQKLPYISNHYQPIQRFKKGSPHYQAARRAVKEANKAGKDENTTPRSADEARHTKRVARNKVWAALEALINDQPWPALLTSSRNSESWVVTANTVPADVLAAFHQQAATWWLSHRAQNTPLVDVLAAHQSAFPWPARLPAISTLVTELVHPDHLGADPKAARLAASQYLATIKAARAKAREERRVVAAERAAVRAAARQEREKAQRQAEEEQAAAQALLLSTGQLPDNDRRTWRRLTEVAELAGLSVSTVHADVKKGRLAVTDKILVGYYKSPTTVHSRPALRAWLEKWRPTLKRDWVDYRLLFEQEAYNALAAERDWRNFLAPVVANGMLLPDGFTLSPPESWPSAIRLIIGTSAHDAQNRFKGIMTGRPGQEALQAEYAWLSRTWAELLEKRAAQGGWTSQHLSQVKRFLTHNLAASRLVHQTAWPNTFNPVIEERRLARLLATALEVFIRANPKVLAQISQQALTDPLSWFPAARKIKRHWVLHLGPTNSGKTHDAMVALRNAATGIYLAPLRLMALEGYDRLVAEGVSTRLVTGEERQDSAPNPTHVSATIEAGFSEEHVYEVSVIDEAQMMFDEQRGWAWSQVLAGVCAKTIHVCAAPEAKRELLKMIAALDETHELVEHTRLTPLNPIPAPISLQSLTRGDALVVFSRRQLLGYRAWLRNRGHSVAVIYGDLGPEVRRAEAERFRSGKADILVATDAIGMGLNLPIQRVIFADTEKFDGTRRRSLYLSEWKQIAGRAGRHGLYDQGFYGRLEGAAKFGQLDVTAGSPKFLPPTALVRRLGVWFGWTNLTEVAQFWHKSTPGILPSSSWSEYGWLTRLANSGLGLEDQYRYLGAPVAKSTVSCGDAWVRQHAAGKPVTIKVCAIPDQVSDRKDLEALECYAHEVRLYRWCALAFPEVYPQDVSDLHASLSQSIARSLEKMELANRCDSCGKSLPPQHPHANCDPCFRSSPRRHGGGLWHNDHDDDDFNFEDDFS